MLLEPGERTTTVSQVAEELRSIAAQSNSVVLVAEVAADLVGYAEATGGLALRNRHTAHVVIGVRQQHAGQGIGGRLLGELERWARTNHVHRLELTVMTQNKRAVDLYRKMGYSVEGTRHSPLLVENEFVNEFWMAKLLG